MSEHLRSLIGTGDYKSFHVLDLLFVHTGLLLTLTDKQGVIVKQSSAFQKLLKESLRNQFHRFEEFLDGSSRYDYEKSLEYIVRESKPVRNLQVEFTPPTPLKNKVLTMIPLEKASSRDAYILHLVHDSAGATDRKADLAQIEKLTNVGQIAAGIAHELNTPLGSIILAAGDIVETSDNPEIVAEATRIKHRAEHCSTVVKELLGYVRQSEPGNQRIRVSAVVTKVLELTSAECTRRSIAVRLNDGDADIELECNVNQIEQVLFNLINNAMYAIGENGGIDIEIRYDSMLKRVIIRVRDDGPGIPAARIDKIFNPFFTTKPGSQGTGLGLAICKKIVLEHGGDIAVTSKEREGSVFEMWFPRIDD